MTRLASHAREQQKGGHFVKRDGSLGRGEDGDKYHHKHTPDKNPAQSGGHYATVKGTPAPAPAPAPKPAPKKAKPARKPKDLSKIPDSLLTDAERKQKKAAADVEAAKEKAASRERRRKVAEEEERARKEAQEGERRYSERMRKREADKKKAKADAAARKRATVSKAKKTLKLIGQSWRETKERKERRERDERDRADDREFAAKEEAERMSKLR